MFNSFILQGQLNLILRIIIQGLYLGGVVGVLMGIIAWVAGEKGGRSLSFMFGGGVFGLILGFVITGSGLVSMFGSAEALLLNANQASSATFRAILMILFFTLAGVALGGVMVSFGRAVSGAFIGLLAGTVAGIILVLLNVQVGLNVVGPVATILVGFMTLILVGIMSIGQAKS